MKIFKNFKTLDSKFSWSFLGFIIGALGFGYAIYVDQFKVEQPKVIFDVLSNTQVLSVKENLNKLDIIYDGQNLKEQKENLILLTIRISNEGNEDIRENDYYSQTPFGLTINGGKIAEKPIIIDASNKVLKENLSLSYDTLNNIRLNKVPFNQGQYFTIKVLTICKENNYPSIKPMGSITGINEEFPVLQSYKDGQKEEKSFIEQLTFGNFGIHVARFFYYLLCIIVFGLGVGIPLAKLSSDIEDRKKRKKIQKFRDKTKIRLSDKVDLIFDIYKNYDGYLIQWVSQILGDKEKLKKYITHIENRKSESDIMEDYAEVRNLDPEVHNDEYLQRLTARDRVISKLLDKQVITKEKDEIFIDKQFRTELLEFCYFIEIQ